MTRPGGPGPDPGAAEREALRRRLYRPEATADDVAAFAAATPPAPEAAAAVDPAARRRTPRRVAAAAGAVAVAVAALLVAGPLLRPAPDDPAAPTAATAPPAESPSPADAIASGPEQAGFIAQLTRGRQAGVSAWLDRHADRLPGALAQASRSDTLEFAGDGTRTVRLDPPSVGQDGGRVTVLVVLTADADATWTLLGPSGGAGSEQVLGSASGGQDAGTLTAASVPYPPGGRPQRLRIAVPAGVRWGVSAVFSD